MPAYNLANQAGALFRAALNTVLGKLQRHYYGTADPVGSNEHVAGMFWWDSTGERPILKIRNASNTRWINFLELQDPPTGLSYLYQLLFNRVFISLTGSEEVPTLNVNAETVTMRSVTNEFARMSSAGMFFRGGVTPFTNGGGALGSTGSRWSTANLVTAPNVSSDWRLKEGFADYTETDLAAARLIKPQTFRMKASGKGSSGYVAQQILDAFDQAGSTHERPVELGLMEMGEDGMWGVHYELVNALRIEALSR
jgi:hypothetical protein